MIILALDQSSQISGYSVFNDKELVTSGTFTASTTADIGKRLEFIRNKVDELITKYNIDELKIEDIQLQVMPNKNKASAVPTNVHTYKILAEVIGVIQELAAERKIPIEIITSSSWRSTLGITGAKREVYKANAQKYVKQHYGLDVSEDEADAICIGAYAVSGIRDGMFNWV